MVPGDAEEWSVFEITPQAAESEKGNAAAAAPAPGWRLDFTCLEETPHSISATTYLSRTLSPWVVMSGCNGDFCASGSTCAPSRDSD